MKLLKELYVTKEATKEATKGVHVRKQDGRKDRWAIYVNDELVEGGFFEKGAAEEAAEEYKTHVKEAMVTKDAGHDDTFENVRKAVKKMTDAELIKFSKELPGSKAKEFKAGTPRKELEDYVIEVIHNASWKTRKAFVTAKLKESASNSVDEAKLEKKEKEVFNRIRDTVWKAVDDLTVVAGNRDEAVRAIEEFLSRLSVK